VNLVHQIGLDELAFRQRRYHFEDRFIGKERCALRESVNLAREAELAQRLDKLGFEERQGGEVIQSGLVKAYILEVIQHRAQARRQQEVALLGQFAHRKRENRLVQHALGLISLHHGQLVKVCEKRLPGVFLAQADDLGQELHIELVVLAAVEYKAHALHGRELL